MTKDVERTTITTERLLTSLEMAGMSPQQILVEMEREGMHVRDLVRWAEGFLLRTANVESPKAATLLVFGCVRKWQPLLPTVRTYGSEMLKFLQVDHPGYLQCIARLMPHPTFQQFRGRVLKRLGYPSALSKSLMTRVETPKRVKEVVTWLDAGQPIVAFSLELRFFHTTAPKWGVIHSPTFMLQDGIGPHRLCWRSDPLDPSRWHVKPSLRIDRVRELKELNADPYGQVILNDCHSLNLLCGPSTDLEINYCSNLKEIPLRTTSNRLLIRNCHGLKAIVPWSDEDNLRRSQGVTDLYELEALDIIGCPRLRSLPPRLRVRGNLHLRETGPVETWPWDFQIGGDFLVAECPNIEQLPPMEVQGSLRVTGHTGLRRLSAGTIIAKHLDLRACTELEGIPRGVKVGGNMYLPESITSRRTVQLQPVTDGMLPLNVVQGDLYDLVYIMLKGLKFAALLQPEARINARELAFQALASFKERIAQNPKVESHLLWAASEAWRDLTGEAWAAFDPMASEQNEAEEDLPMAWFLAQLNESEP